MSPTGKGPLRIALEDFLTGFGFGKRIADWMRDRLEQWEIEAIDAYDGFLQASGVGDNVPDLIRPANLRGLVKHQIALIALLLPIMWQIISQVTAGLIGPFARPLGYLAEALAHSKHPDAPIIYQIMQRRPDLAEKLKSLLPGTGFDDLSLEGFRSLVLQLLTPADYERLKLRGALTEDQAHDRLSRSGYSEEDIAGLDELVRLIPGPSDLISMAVREAWNDETVSRFEYDAGLDQIPEFVEHMARQGYSEDWSKRYWRAHWQLPGVNQAYEMLHRLRSGDNAFTRSDMELLLRTADIPKFFRDRLIAISYQPYTRVDIRRMYKANVLDAAAVHQAYLDIGYDEEHATKLTEFTTAEQKSDKSDLTRNAIISAYKRGIYSRDQAASGIAALGLSADDVEFYLDLADYDLQAQVTDVQLSVIQAKYVSGIIDEPSLAGALGSLNLPSERMQALTELWTIQRTNKTNVPSRGELDDLLRRGIIDHDVYRKQLRRDGFETDVVEQFVLRIDQIIADDAQAEMATQQAEQERLALATRKTVYQVSAQDINVQIAQLRSAIADLQLQSNTVTDETQRKSIFDTILLYKTTIVHLNEDKANLKLDFVTPTTPGG